MRSLDGLKGIFCNCSDTEPSVLGFGEGANKRCAKQLMIKRTNSFLILLYWDWDTISIEPAGSFMLMLKGTGVL
jgi:hypothetical protein